MRISDWSSDVCSSDLHGDTKAFALAAHQIFRRYANAVEIDLRSRLGMPAEFLFLRAEADARHNLFDDEAAYALGAIVARADHHDIDFVLATTGDELLGTCDDIIVPVTHRFGFQAASIRPRACFGQAIDGHLFHRDQGRQIFVLD